MYRVTNDMFAEIADMNEIARQKFSQVQSEPYGPDEMDSLFKISDELKKVASFNRSVAMEARLLSQALLKQQKAILKQAHQSSASVAVGSNTV
jgi:hypothetical protein